MKVKIRNIRTAQQRTIDYVETIDKIEITKDNDSDVTGIMGGPGYLIILHRGMTNGATILPPPIWLELPLQENSDPIRKFAETKAEDSDTTVMEEIPVTRVHFVFVMDDSGETVDVYPSKKEREKLGY